TLNRPEKMNAMGVAMQRELVAAVLEAGKDDEVRVIVIKGAGRCFSAGWDIEPSSPDPIFGKYTIIQDLERLREKENRLLTIRDVLKPTIAQIHGYCLAGAAHIAAMCDIAIVAEDAIIGDRSGPQGAGFITPMWLWALGSRKAREMRFAIGTTLSGVEAERLGFANKAVPADRLEAEVNELATRIAQTPLDLLKLDKMLLNRAEDLMGYRAIAELGSDIDVIARVTPGAKAYHDLVKERGLKRALKEWPEALP
ncbi:MAG: enoyl-CoA hydratase/isomerase family protein, partial [Chloroflexi bacterium]|nr:enoyl-CoA hydratase/isomerase family protein [Chloroflexota bacterium]